MTCTALLYAERDIVGRGLSITPMVVTFLCIRTSKLHYSYSRAFGKWHEYEYEWGIPGRMREYWGSRYASSSRYVSSSRKNRQKKITHDSTRRSRWDGPRLPQPASAFEMHYIYIARVRYTYVNLQSIFSRLYIKDFCRRLGIDLTTLQLYDI